MKRTPEEVAALRKAKPEIEAEIERQRVLGPPETPSLTAQIAALQLELEAARAEARIATECEDAANEDAMKFAGRLARAEALLARSQSFLRAGDMRHEVPVLKEDIRAFLEGK